MLAPRYSSPPEQPPLVDRAVAYKTVATFAGITKRKIFLRPGERSRTDGTVITVPFSDPNYYQKVEHELAHILFRSDGLAKQTFVSEYVKLVTKHATDQGMVLRADRLTFLVSSIIGLLEDYRVNGLWGCLYPGSYELLKEMARAEAEHLLPKAHKSFLYFMVCVYADCDVPNGLMSPFRPVIEHAFDAVSKRGFAVTLATAKWLVIQIVNILIESSKLGPIQAFTPGTIPTDPDPVKRLDALQQFETLLSGEGEPLEEVTDKFSDFDDLLKPEYVNVNDRSFALAHEALRFDPKDSPAFEVLLNNSKKEMQVLLDEAKNRLRAPMQHDDWIQQEAKAKILLQDVTANDITESVQPMSAEDQDSVRRLRSIFQRVMGRRALELRSSGSRVDVGAYLERRLTQEDVPCFQEDISARGFRCLVLLDRSASMNGDKTKQAERACRILTRALHYPFVEFEVWGFNAYKGQVVISRFEKGLESFTSQKSLVLGQTPLHIAIRTAARHLSGGGTMNQVFAITDGLPIYDPKGEYITVDERLLFYTRQEVQLAKSRSVSVTGLVISRDAKPVQLVKMFGRDWKYLDKDHVGSGTVTCISDRFVRYLKAA